MAAPRLSRAALLALALALAAAYHSFAQRAGALADIRYELEISPRELVRGGSALIVIQAERMSASSTSVESIRLGKGLELESRAIRPYVMAGGAPGVELRLGFALRESGPLRIESLVIASAEGRISIGPLVLQAEEPSSPDAVPPARPVLWEWRLPAAARMYREIEIALVRADGGAIENGLVASFDVPEGATIEGAGYLKWKLVPLAEGKLVLPDAELSPAPGSKARKGEAFAAAIRVEGAAKPPAVAASGPPAAAAPAAAAPSGADGAAGAGSAAIAPSAAAGTATAPVAPAAVADLAACYKVMRHSLPFERARREAAASAAELRSRLGIEGEAVKPLLDFLPPPAAFLFPAALLALAAAVAALLRRGRRRVGPSAAAIVLALAAALSLALSGASALERRKAYAIAWTRELGAVPSPMSELKIRVPLGSTAELGIQAAGYAALSLADGVIAWAPSALVFEY